MFKDKVVVITGGAGGIGKCIAEEFEKVGAKVCVIDIAENPYFVGDIGDEATLRSFTEKVISEHGKVDYLINNAPPLFKGVDECTYEEFNYALREDSSDPGAVDKSDYRIQQRFVKQRMDLGSCAFC